MTELTVAVCNFANVPLKRQSLSDSKHLITLILLLTFSRTSPLSQYTTSRNMCCDNGEVLIDVIELTLIRFKNAYVHTHYLRGLNIKQERINISSRGYTALQNPISPRNKLMSRGGIGLS
jgi:hypothetical protein